MPKFQYRYINPGYLLKHQILNEDELSNRKIHQSNAGELYGRQYLGIFLIEKQFCFWIPEKSINNVRQNINVISTKPKYYRFRCTDDKYLYLDKALLIPKAYTTPKNFISKMDKSKLLELECHIGAILKKIKYCVHNNIVENYLKMKEAYEQETKDLVKMTNEE